MHLIVGENLRLLRKQKGWSQEQVADHLNISQAAYARIEKGKTNSWSIHLEKICKIFKCKPEKLFDNSSLHHIIIKENKINESSDIKIIAKLIEQYELRLDKKEKLIIALSNKLANFKD